MLSIEVKRVVQFNIVKISRAPQAPIGPLEATGCHQSFLHLTFSSVSDFSLKPPNGLVMGLF